jgi:hypothetical protein
MTEQNADRVVVAVRDHQVRFLVAVEISDRDRKR